MPDLNTLELTVVEMIRVYTPQDLQYAIDRDVDLSELLRTFSPSLVWFARLCAPAFRGSASSLNESGVTDWLHYNRPDLYEVIQGSQVGRNWFRKQIKGIKCLIFGDGT